MASRVQRPASRVPRPAPYIRRRRTQDAGRGTFLFIAFFLTAGCAPKKAQLPVVHKPAFDLTKVHRVAVLRFEGETESTVSSEFVRQLVASGVEVSEETGSADALLSGSVVMYKTNDKTMVFLGNGSATTSSGQALNVTNPVVSMAAAQTAPEAASFSFPKTQVISIGAAVGVAVKLAERSTGKVIWGGEFQYEAIDAQTAVQAVATVLVGSLRRDLTAAQARPVTSEPKAAR